MASWLRRAKAGIQSAPATPAAENAPTSAVTLFPTNYGTSFQKDPNAPDVRLDVESRCIYERRLPGKAYITAHVTRLQHGYYDTPSTHGDCIENVRFIAIYFCFHPEELVNRFQAATISISLHDDTDQQFTDPAASYKPQSIAPVNKPKFLKFAPHVLYGGVSPETLDWNFNLTGSLGVSQAPVSASISPSGGIKTSYKVFQMMRIQGSTRTVRASRYDQYDIEDGQVIWTLEENPLQKSGLPREFTFVLLATKGDVENVVFQIDIQPKVSAWFGHYPRVLCDFIRYLPLHKESTDLDHDLGQVFIPADPDRGYNFANLVSRFDTYVSLPGTTTSGTDRATVSQPPPDPAQQSQPSSPQKTQQPQSAHPNNVGLAPGGKSTSSAGQTSSQGSSQSKQNASNGKQTAPSKPADYHIYLDNPRSIILHASPPALDGDQAQEKSDEEDGKTNKQHESLYPLKTDPQSLSHHQQSIQSQSNAISQTNSIHPQARTPRRPTSNTKLKRRSIDISYMSPSSPSQNLSQRQSSLRRSRSRSDLRGTSSPLVEEIEIEVDERSARTNGADEQHGIPYPARPSQQPLYPVDDQRPPRLRDSPPSPPRIPRDFTPYAVHNKDLGGINKRYSMPV